MNSKAIVFQSLANLVAESKFVTAFSNAINSDNDQILSDNLDSDIVVEEAGEVGDAFSLITS